MSVDAARGERSAFRTDHLEESAGDREYWLAKSPQERPISTSGSRSALANAACVAGVLREFGFPQVTDADFLEERRVIRMGVPPCAWRF